MRKPNNAWPNSEGARNVLYAVQAMSEMLKHETFESFRAPTLDTLFRLYETHHVASQIKNRRVKSAAINPIIDELVWSIANDPVITTAIPDEAKEFTDSIEGLKNPNTAQATNVILQCQNLNRRLEPIYARELKNEFSAIYTDMGQRTQSLKVCQHLISHLTNMGYDQRFILRSVEERFLEKDLKKIEKRTLSHFLKRFDGMRKDYEVIIPVSEAGHSFVDALSLPVAEALSSKDVPDRAKKALAKNVSTTEFPKYVKLEVGRLDPFAAHTTAVELMQSLQSLTLLQREMFELEWSDFAYVTTKRSHGGLIIERDTFVLQRGSDKITKSRAKSLHEQARSLILSFDRESMERAIRATGTVSLAREADNSENQLVLLWSSIEALLSDPPEGVARIAHYLEAIVPCICINYPRRYLCAVLEDAQLDHKKALREFVRQVEVDTDDYPLKFAHFVIDPKYRQLQNEFCKSIDDNPLALFRFWKLFSNFQHGAAFHQSIQGHDNRVNWQIARIYRVRNEIVHAGSGPQYTRALALNAFEYFKTAFATIVNRASNTEINEDITQVVSSIQFDYSIFKSKVAAIRHSETPLSEAAISSFFSKR